MAAMVIGAVEPAMGAPDNATGISFFMASSMVRMGVVDSFSGLMQKTADDGKTRDDVAGHLLCGRWLRRIVSSMLSVTRVISSGLWTWLIPPIMCLPTDLRNA